MRQLRNHIAMDAPWIPAISGVFALADWWAVAHQRRVVEWVCKPAVMVFLIWWALALDPECGPQRAWFVAALALSLAGDVFLMLPRDLFVFGLGSFLLGHLAFIAGFSQRELDGWLFLATAAAVAVAGRVVGRPVLAAVRGHKAALVPAVVAYMAVISAMVVFAVATEDVLAGAGALFFYVSDATLAWNKFVRPLPWGKVRIIVTYHIAQFLLVWSLAS